MNTGVPTIRVNSSAGIIAILEIMSDDIVIFALIVAALHMLHA